MCACEMECACGEYNTCKYTPAIEHAWGSVSMHLSQLGMSVQLLLLHAVITHLPLTKLSFRSVHSFPVHS